MVNAALATGLWLHILLGPSQWAWALASEFYTAGVAEFRPAVAGASSLQLLADNLDGYLELIAHANGTSDILVFPEATLNSVLQLTAVPESTTRSLCDQSAEDDPGIAEFLRTLACAAREHHTYLVVNVKERALDPESLRGYAIYNTNVVFDRSGRIVSRYRKWNLYLEPMTNRTEVPELATFKTDFNVTFGHIICFDMLFYEPAQQLVEQLGVRHIIATNMFNSEMPFLTAPQFQQGWAWANRVNLMVAGASLPGTGVSGSGIYAAAHGALTRLLVTDDDTGRRQLLLARVPVNPRDDHPAIDLSEEPEQAGASVRLKLLQQPELRMFTTWELPMLPGSAASKRICQEDLCCSFDMEWTVTGEGEGSQPDYNYRVGVWVGRRRYEEEQYSSIRLCGLFACLNASVESCGLLRQDHAQESRPVEFTQLRIEGEFVPRPRRLISPNTLSASGLYPLQPGEMSWSLEELSNVTLVRLELQRPHDQLMTFAIYGNYFDEPESGGCAAPGTSLCLIFASTLALHLTIGWLLRKA
ncbi:hypothetical protein KR018_002259 [Drosophila ironensis]|nr:hypothetical protein KR018_002259 [Drosophila ironensis]